MKEETMENTGGADVTGGISRRRFLNYAGLASAGLLIASCKDDNPKPATTSGTVDMGSGDTGVMNYAYALKQVEAAFYIKLTENFSAWATEEEKIIFQEIRDHKIAQREFFRNELGSKAIRNLEFNFEAIDFTDKVFVIKTADTFEDISVGGYNGAAKLLVTPEYLVMLGKIVSVSARHSAFIKEILTENSFASTTDGNGMDLIMTTDDALAMVNAYLTTKISGTTLPKD